MSTKTLVIDGDDRQHFFLAVEGYVVRIGDNSAQPGGVMRGLKVVRIHCEVVVEDDHFGVVLDGQPKSLGEAARPREVMPGEAVQLGHAQMSVVADSRPIAPPRPASNPEDSVPAAASATAIAAPPGVRKRLRVIDGADQGRMYNLPPSGTVTIGKSEKHADIVLHDLYVSRVHCALEIEDGIISVSHVLGDNGTMVDGQRIEMPRILNLGSVVRVSNSHLRLELGSADEEAPKPKSGDTSTVMKALTRQLPVPAEAAPELPATIGHYQLGELLGRGYCGVVHKATDVKTGQTVVLKVLDTHFPAAVPELEKFGRALKVGTGIHHPNLVAPLGAGKNGPHTWIAREYVEGESAADVIARIWEGEKPSWTRAARVAVHLARALGDLQMHQLPHGNITPRNVLLRKADHATLLTDLRLAEALAGSQWERAYHEKKRLAELPYTAPELTDAGGQPDDLTDLYAVGAVVYALVTGRPPFAGKTADEIVRHIHEGRISKPSAYYKKVPAAFENIVLKLLAKHPADRYPAAAAVLEDLEPLAQMHEIKL